MRKPLAPLPESERLRRLREMGLDGDLLPLHLTDAERTAAMSEPTPAPPVSPTGAPVVSPAGLAFKLLAVVMAVAGAVAIRQPDLFSSTELDQQVAVVLMAIIGFVSPGLRRPG